MRASVLVDVGRMELRDVPEPEIGAYDALVRSAAVGVCGTDFHIYSGEANYNYDRDGNPVPLTTEPQTLGHEIVAEVLEVGSQVDDISAGERVVVDQGLSCVSSRREPMCEYCKSGVSHQCQFYREYGITGLAGGFSEYLSIPAVNLMRIESDLTADMAALTEPLSCILHTTEMMAASSARYELGASEPDRRVRAALVCGAGPAGLLFVQTLRAVHGFDGELLVSEPNPAKRALAERFGATTFDPGSCDLREVVRERTDGRMLELLIEASGAGEAFAQIPGLIRRQATVVKYGIGHGGQGLELLNEVQWKEPTFLMPVGASSGFDSDGRPTNYRRSLRLIEDGTIAVSPLVTHRYEGLGAVPRAFGGDHRRREYVKGVAIL